MATYTYKTTLSCSGCVGKIEKFLNAEKSILKWEVDLNSPDKLLRIETDSFEAGLIPALLLKAGYKASAV